MDQSVKVPAAIEPVDEPIKKVDGLRIIALLKLGKALLLIVTSYGVHALLNASLLERLNSWSATLTDSVERRLLLRALDYVQSLGASKIQLIMAVTIAYTAIVLVEGFGLWFRQRWAQWVTVVATASLIPFELWELITRPASRKFAILLALAFNVGVAWYLAWLIRKRAVANQEVS